MGTGAYIAIHNQLGSPVQCTVANSNCMYQDGDEGSHLEQLNTTIQANAISPSTYLEADDSGTCLASQSFFSLNFSLEGTNLGTVVLNLGSGAFNTAIAENNCPQIVDVQLGESNDQYTFTILLNSPSTLQLLVNSWLSANSSAIENSLVFPQALVSGITFGAAALQGLATLICTSASYSYFGGNLSLTLSADQLFTNGSIAYAGQTVQSGLVLTSPQISATGIVRTLGNALQIALTGIQLQSSTVNFSAAGIQLPSLPLSALMGALEYLVNNTFQAQIIRIVNGFIPPLGG